MTGGARIIAIVTGMIAAVIFTVIALHVHFRRRITVVADTGPSKPPAGGSPEPPPPPPNGNGGVVGPLTCSALPKWPKTEAAAAKIWPSFEKTAREVLVDFEATHATYKRLEAKGTSDYENEWGPYWRWIFTQAVTVAIVENGLGDTSCILKDDDDSPMGLRLAVFKDEVRSAFGDKP